MNSTTTGATDQDPADEAVTGAWASLGWQARAFRIAHVVFGVLNMAGLAYVWASAVLRRRDRGLRASVGLLSAEGVALVIGRGNCPFGPFQRSLGDPVPMFELVLPPRAAKAAIPVLAVISLAGFAAVALRPPRGGGNRRSAALPARKLQGARPQAAAFL